MPPNKSFFSVSEDSGSFCDFNPLFKESRPTSSTPSPVNLLSSSPATPRSTSSPATRTSSLRKLGHNRIDPDEANELLVVSTEDVVDGQILPQKSSPLLKSDAYVPASATRDRPEYVPPRSLAHQIEDEDTLNKGCYYFMACLDSLWVL